MRNKNGTGSAPFIPFQVGHRGDIGLSVSCMGSQVVAMMLSLQPGA